MKVTIRKTHYRGARYPLRELQAGTPLAGTLTYSTMHYRAGGTISSLNLQRFESAIQEGQLAELLEPQLISLGNNRMRFRGIEVVEGCGYVQEWLVEVG